MQRRNILAMLAGLAIAAPMVGAQQAAKQASATAQKGSKEQAKGATTATTAGKPDSAKANGVKKKAKKHKKAS